MWTEKGRERVISTGWERGKLSYTVNVKHGAYIEYDILNFTA